MTLPRYPQAERLLSASRRLWKPFTLIVLALMHLFIPFVLVSWWYSAFVCWITSVAVLPDSVLARLVQWLTQSNDPDLVTSTIAMLNTALARIDPEDIASHQARSLLVSRPVALVRARIGLSTLNSTAEDRSLRALRSRMDGAAPDTHGWEDVRVPVRLGEHGHLGDGLCGYWIEDALSRFSHHLHTPHGLDNPSPHESLSALSGDNALSTLPLQLALSDNPVTVAMLIDPRASIHATTGILPVKSVRLPPEHYRAQLSKLRVTFKMGPILTPIGEVEIPLP